MRALLCPAYWHGCDRLTPIRCEPNWLSAIHNISDDVRCQKREFDHLLDASFDV